MIDQFNRKITYLRISLTDRCNFRCRYCMPEEGIDKLDCKDIMSYEEILRIVRVCAGLGIEKVRISGGEPFVRKNPMDFLEKLAKIQGIKDIGITTNGSLVLPYLDRLEKAGIKRLNFSLDTLKKDKFAYITRRGNFETTMQAIERAIDRGFKVKINCVLMGSFNTDEIDDFVYLTKDNDIDVRFIELMPIGPAGAFKKEIFFKNSDLLDRLFKEYGRPGKEPGGLEEVETDGVAKMFKICGYKGRIGLISPISHSFCASCNRIRLTADGKIKPCLHSAKEYDLKGLEGEELTRALEEAILAKPQSHHLQEAASLSKRGMNMIGG